MRDDELEGDEPLLPVNDLTLSAATGGSGRSPAPPFGAPNAKVVAALLGVLVLMIGAYALGRQGGDLAVVPDAAPTPAATVLPDAAPGPTVLASIAPQRLIADTLGPGFVLGGLGLGFSNQVLVYCRAEHPTSGLRPSLIAVHAGVNEGQSYVIAQTEIASPPAGAGVCEGCAPQRRRVNDELMLVGSCGDGPDGDVTAYVLAVHPEFWKSPLALHLRCEVTSVDVGDDEIVVTSRRQRTALGAPVVRPQVRIERRDGRFVADDVDLLASMCDLGASSQLVGFDPDRREPSGWLPYEVTESELGPIGVYGPVLVALDAEQCDVLSAAWWAGQGPGGEPGERTLIALTGLEPPGEVGDWFYTCDGAVG